MHRVLSTRLRLIMNLLRSIYFIIFHVGLLLIINSCNSAKENTVNRIVPVKVSPLKYEQRSFPIQRSGILAAKSEVKLSFKVGGIIEDIWVDEGQLVKKGQPLASLALNEMRAFLDQARSGYEKAQRDLERVTRLWNDKVATLEQRQDAETGFKMAQANLQIAEFNLKHAQIIAPADGKILKRFAEKNELVPAGQPIFYFSATDSKWVVRLGVAESEIVMIQRGDSALITFAAYPSVKFPGMVSELAAAVDPRSGTFEVEVEVQSSFQKLISGFVAQVEIHPSPKTFFYLIPIDALVEAENTHGYIFTLLPGGQRVKKIPVQIDHFSDQEVALSTDLKNVSTVITAGAAYLQDSTQVKVIRE
jgi:multidrug efflux system membrane fusion protein